MLRNEIIRRLFLIQCSRTSIRHQSSSNSINIEKLEQESVDLELIDDDAKLRLEELERKRNKSGLNARDRNIVHNRPPYSEPIHWSHGTLKYHRKLYGRYGESSGVDPALCWPTKQELADKKEYEKVAYPFTIPEMIATGKNLRREKEERIQKRQKEIVAKMLKLDSWTRDLKLKIASKEAEAKAAKERKEKLVEEVRRHFGYTVDPRDEKFKEMLERKEKEQKKAMKEARKKVKEEKMITKLLVKNVSETAPVENLQKESAENTKPDGVK